MTDEEWELVTDLMRAKDIAEEKFKKVQKQQYAGLNVFLCVLAVFIVFIVWMAAYAIGYTSTHPVQDFKSYCIEADGEVLYCVEKGGKK
jgi:hypothetical protein